MLIAFIVAPIGAYAEDKFEVDKTAIGENVFYWPKELPLPEGATFYEMYDNKIIDFDGKVKHTNGQVVTKYLVAVSFLTPPSLTTYDRYRDTVLKTFPVIDEEQGPFMYDNDLNQTYDLSYRSDWLFQEVHQRVFADTKLTFPTQSIANPGEIYDHPVADIWYEQTRFRTQDEVDRYIESGMRYEYNRHHGCESYFEFALYVYADKPITDINEFHKYTNFPLVKINVDENGEAVNVIALEDGGEYVKPDAAEQQSTNGKDGITSQKEGKEELPDTENYSVGDVVVIGGATFVLMMIAGVPTWVRQVGVVPNYKNNPSSSTSEPKERKDFSKYGLQETKDGNWIKQLNTKDGELYHSITYDENGKPKSEYILKPGNGGQVRKEIYTNDKGEIYKVNEFNYDSKNELVSSSEVKYNEKHELTQKDTYDKDGRLIEQQKKVRSEKVVGKTMGDLDVLSEDYIEVNKYDGDGNKISTEIEDYKSSTLGKYESDWAYELDSKSMREKLKVGRGQQYKI